MKSNDDNELIVLALQTASRDRDIKRFEEFSALLIKRYSDRETLIKDLTALKEYMRLRLGAKSDE